MENEDLIAADAFCINHQVDISFIRSLHQSGLIEITDIQQTSFLPSSQLYKVEQFIRFHYDLDINMEGIEAIAHLLDRVKYLQDEITMLKNRVSFYEK